MAESVDGEDRLLEGHALEVQKCFRPPIYSCDTYPQFPQELIDLICEFLRLDPFTLTRCCLVCHAWYQAARHLFWHEMLWLFSREALDDFAHTLISKGNRSYGKNFDNLHIWEDPRRPIAHIWPMRIPGYLLPRAKVLELCNFDWAATRPHDLFFRFLSYYTSITTLEIKQSRFRDATQLRRIFNALPSLETLVLHGVTLQHPLTPGSAPSFVSSRRNKLTTLRFWNEADVPAEWDAHKQAHSRSLLDVCSAYSSVVDLALDLRYYSSLSHLHQYLRHFPKLACSRLQDAISPYAIEPAMAADMVPAYSVDAPALSLSTFELSDVPMPWASQLLGLVSTQRACSRLDDLLFAFRDSTPSAELVARITEVLRLAGAGLKTLRWRGDLTEVRLL
ncbi:uncharacterized protein B0H18DRAFT_598155 [Fomitopsis serialis]|uniref:uncharacterized protein n=1 Tax=Fomitopsis serialis TaxID=139415 RepID=UPI0020074B07|nr:uncharacterized protein B0H18DRAFT_598155 [Neoantrodia serialis]KAH9920410.1 hypothetical protein B0H18DRAFT_598155 [Neoantrodia serialis]